MALIRVNISISFHDSTLKWYTSKFDKKDQDNLNKDIGIGNWISIFSQCFKIFTSVILGFLISKTYFLNNTCRCHLFTQYIGAIIRYGIGYNIVNISNQLSFAYQDLAYNTRIFIFTSTTMTKASNFIKSIEEKQKTGNNILVSYLVFRYFLSVQAI